MVVKGLRDRVLAPEEAQVVELRDMRRLRELVRRVEVLRERPSACLACGRAPFGSLALWVMGGGGSALMFARRIGG